MYNYLLSFLMLNLLLISIILGMSVSNPLALWMMMEMNFLVFLLMMGMSNSMMSECMQYFLVQSVGSAVIIGSLMMMMSNTILESGFNIAILLKLGAAPLHGWFINIVKSVSWAYFWMISTLQKILPLLMLLKLMFTQTLLIVFMGAIVSTVAIFTINAVKELLAFSSVFNLLWLLSCKQGCYLSLEILLVYSLALGAMVLIISSHNKKSENYFNIKEMKLSDHIVILLCALSMGGIPPLPGFFMKLQVLNYLLNLEEMFIMLVLLINSSVMLFLYIRLMSLGTMEGEEKGLMTSFTGLKVSAIMCLVVTVLIF